jgi:hypothetical protein
MNEPTFRVFVSSTWLDLGPEREAVRDAVLRTKETQFVGMEYFGSRDETTRRASLDEVDRSQLYVGLFAARYGSGITEAEYRRARERHLPCLIYFKDDDAVTGDWRETDPAQAAKLDALKSDLLRDHDVTTFTNPDNLAAHLAADLHRWLFKEYLTPKLRGALGGEVSREEAQALLGAVRDLSALSRDLVTRLQGTGFNLSVGGNFIGRDNVTNIYAAPERPSSTPVRTSIAPHIGAADVTLERPNGADAPPSRIFICYRRGAGVGYAAALLHSRLTRHFGDERVFMDISAIEVGDDFVEIITRELSSCALMVVLINKGWADAGDEGGLRLHEKDDFVRMEVSTALRRNIRVVPVLLDGAPMPRAEELPEDLRALARRNAFKMSGESWERDVGELLARMERQIGR